MEGIKQTLTSIDINSLLKLFDMQISLGVIIVFFICRSLFSRLIIKAFYTLTKNPKNTKECSMYKPLNLYFVMLGIYFAICILANSKQLLYIANKIFKIISIYYIVKFITLAISEDSIFMKSFFTDIDNKAVNGFVCKIVRFIIWIIFIFIVVNELGYDLSGLVAGLGIGSAAIALAAQDLVKSLISGITILTDKPFVIGDWVEIGEYQGTIIDITFRSVRMQTVNNTIITIPNSTVASTYIINWNKLTSRRFECTLNLSLDTSTEKIKTLIKKMRVILENNTDVVKGSVQVHFTAISSSSSDIFIYLYINKTAYVDFLKVKQKILCDLMDLIERENIELAYPTQTLYIRDDNKAEI